MHPYSQSSIYNFACMCICMFGALLYVLNHRESSLVTLAHAVGVGQGCSCSEPHLLRMQHGQVGSDLSHVFCTDGAATVIKGYSPELIVHPYLPDEAAHEARYADSSFVRPEGSSQIALALQQPVRRLVHSYLPGEAAQQTAYAESNICAPTSARCTTDHLTFCGTVLLRLSLWSFVKF